ncbi:MAG: Gfo/Idh/MocA family oxidoreductase, partial [Pedosphaera parvula]|nr:Gfo/Idh/MocA family oxidoreductase [Pedosphaera parvula]
AAAAVSATTLLKTPVYGQNQAPSTGRVIGANDRIAVAYVGVGGQGMAHVRSQKDHAQENNIVQAAICDLYQKRLQNAKTFLGLTDADTYTDHRKLLQRKDIDAVVVSTIDIWHADVAIDALEAGKHVYGEKPMARYLEEGFRIYDTAKRTGKVFELGSQFCADPMYHKSAEWIKAGKLGPLVWAQGSYCRNNAKNSEWTYPVDPDANLTNLEWDRWQGRCRKQSWDPNRFFSWHKYYDDSSGILGNLLPHKFLPLMLATGSPEYPRRVCCTGTRKVSIDREITDTTHLLAEFPNGLTFCVAGSTVNEYGLPDIIRGRKGRIEFSTSANKAELKPERIFSEEIDAAEFADAKPLATLDALEKNFFDCIRSGATPLANIDLALKAHVVLCLAEMSERLNLTLLYDEKTRKVRTGDGKVVPPISYDTVITPTV